MQPFVLFDDAVAGQAKLLHGFVDEDVLDVWAGLDDCLQRGWAKGHHAALAVDYAFAAGGVARVLWFTHQEPVKDVNTWLAQYSGDAGVSCPQSNISESEYLDTVAQIQAAIARGETYQINYTQRLHLHAYGAPPRLYARLRQNVPYAALMRLPARADAPDWLLCFSPELFLRIDETGLIRTEPMKGTAPRLGDSQDAQRAESLRQDPKNRAENTMIVDLLRNDLGKIAETGSVSVPEPFKVSPFGSVWQMTSTVCARLPAATPLAIVLSATFPCGSITGAPKRKSMEIIDLLETAPRGLYTGSIGWIEPCPDSVLGYRACLNVLIRTLCLYQNHQDKSLWRGEYGVGSGIVTDSIAADEYTECAWKARFLSELRPEHGILETMRVENGTIPHLPLHLQRLQESAHALNIPCQTAAIHQQACARAAALGQGVFRLRLALSPQGECEWTDAPLSAAPEPYVLISETVLPTHDFLRRHKTTRRQIFDQTWRDAQAQGAFDALLFDESGALLEGGRSSVMIELDGEMLIPNGDVMHGVARRLLCAAYPQVKIARISRDMLFRAEKICLGNALHAWFEVQLLQKRHII